MGYFSHSCLIPVFFFWFVIYLCSANKHYISEAIMAFIRTQNIKRNSEGTILSGSASVAKSVYQKDARHHSRQVNIESLGKVLWLSDDEKSGIFQSPTRGLVSYDSKEDTFSFVETDDARLKGTKAEFRPLIHSVFGDAYLSLHCLCKYGITGLLKDVFGKELFTRALAHVLYSFASDGSKMTCANFIGKSMFSYFLGNVSPDSLRYDEYYFNALGDDSLKVSFFRRFVAMMKKKDRDFGTSVYVDSTPIPTDSDNPMSRLCCHGTGSSCTQIRLAFVLDQKSGLPVWYDIIPGNVLDVNNLKDELTDVEKSLKISIKSMVLDAGYSSKELLGSINDGRKLIIRMPERKGYPYQELFDSVEKEYNNPDRIFVRNGHNYVAVRKQIELFGDVAIDAYSYIDKDNAESGMKKAEIRMSEDGKAKKEFDAKPENERKRYLMEGGYFVLLSNYGYDEKKTLDEYFGRTHIENFFKDSKEGRRLLPLCKWDDRSVRGKILSDMISTILYTLFRKEMSEAKCRYSEGEKKKGRKPKDLLPLNQITVSEVLSGCSTLMCMKDGDTVYIDTPMKEVKEYFGFFGITIKGSMTMDEIRSELGLSV